MNAPEPDAPQRTEFMRLYRLHMTRACAAKELTQEAAAAEFGLSRNAFAAPTRIPAAIAWPRLQTFLDWADVDGEERATIEREWCIDRMCYGKYGGAIGILIGELRQRLTPREFDAVVDRSVAAYRAETEQKSERR